MATTVLLLIAAILFVVAAIITGPTPIRIISIGLVFLALGVGGGKLLGMG